MNFDIDLINDGYTPVYLKTYYDGPGGEVYYATDWCDMQNLKCDVDWLWEYAYVDDDNRCYKDSIFYFKDKDVADLFSDMIQELDDEIIIDNMVSVVIKVDIKELQGIADHYVLDDMITWIHYQKIHYNDWDWQRDFDNRCYRFYFNDPTFATWFALRWS